MLNNLLLTSHTSRKNSTMTPSFVVFIPTLKCYDLLENLLRRIAICSIKPACVIVLDNGRTWQYGKTEESCRQAKLDFDLPISAAVPESALSVAQSWNWVCNLMFSFSPEESIFILNDDILPDTQAFVKMLSSPQAFVTTKGGYGMFLIRQSCWETVGAFDENFSPAYFEDTDHWLRLRLANFANDIIPIEGYKNQEGGSSTLKRFTPEERAAFDKQFEANRDYYQIKWGGLPGKEKFSTPFNGPSLL